MQTWQPTTLEIGTLLNDRDLTGGDFTATTNPSAVQVTTLIGTTADTIVAIVGPIPEVVEALAKTCCMYGVARDIDLGYTSGRARDERPRALDLDVLYRARLAELQVAVGAADGSDVPGGGGTAFRHSPVGTRITELTRW